MRPYCYHNSRDMSVSNVFDLENDDAMRRLSYTSAILLIVIPFFQTIVAPGMWPIGLGNVQWRFGAANALSGMILIPFLGTVVVLGIARACGHRTIARIVGGLSGFTALVMFGGIGLFMLDSLQLKAVVKTQLVPQFQQVVFRVVLVTAIFAIAYLWLAIVAFRSPEGAAKPVAKGSRKSEEGKGPGFLIGQE